MTIPEENKRSDTDRALGSPANFYWWAGMLVSLACIGVLPLITTWEIGPVALGGVLLSVILWIRGILGQAVSAVFITALFLAGGLLAIIAIHPQLIVHATTGPSVIDTLYWCQRRTFVSS